MAESKFVSKQEQDGVKKIRKNRFIALFMMVLFVPMTALIGDTVGSELIVGIFGFSYFIITAVLLGIVTFSKCPRCNKYFFWSGIWANGFASKCVHCGLSIKAKAIVP